MTHLLILGDQEKVACKEEFIGYEDFVQKDRVSLKNN